MTCVFRDIYDVDIHISFIRLFSNDINKSSTFIVRNEAAKFVHDLFSSNSDKKEERHSKP